jgi:hypothetical protein
MTTEQRLEEIEAMEYPRASIMYDEWEWLITTLRQQLVVSRKAKEALGKCAESYVHLPEAANFSARDCNMWGIMRGQIAREALAEIEKLEQGK